jgi:hypothetical protein
VKLVAALLWLLMVLVRLALTVLALHGLSDSASHEHLQQQQVAPLMQQLRLIRDKEAASSSSRLAGVEVEGVEAAEVLAGAVVAGVHMCMATAAGLLLHLHQTLLQRLLVLLVQLLSLPGQVARRVVLGVRLASSSSSSSRRGSAVSVTGLVTAAAAAALL